VISSWLVIWPEASTRFVIGDLLLDNVDLLARRVLTTPVGPLTCLGSATSLRVSVRQSLNRRQSRRVVAAVKSRLREYVANRDSLLNKWNPQAWWRPPDSTKPLYLTVTLFDLVISSDPSGTCPITATTAHISGRLIAPCRIAFSGSAPRRCPASHRGWSRARSDNPDFT
jgi:hypothetical protein